MIPKGKYLLFILCTLSLIPSTGFSQKISGVIKDAEGNAIKYATLYIEELQTGTSANQHGEYAIYTGKGAFNLSVRALGFTPSYEKITVKTTDVQKDITLYQQSYILAGVTIRADNEDPAYSIMRNAIARAPAFINQAESYSSELYMKGAIKVKKIPKIIAKKLEVNGERPQEGQIYINESVSRITFNAPDKYRQEVISVNNTFPFENNDAPVLQMSSGSIYKSMDDFYISPFAPNAFAHYNFEHVGLLQDGEYYINKIKVTPKRKSKLLMEGYLYIVDELWCVYSYDIVLKPMFTSVRLKQFYAPVKGNNFLPVNIFAEADFSAMGVEASGTYTSTIKYFNVKINPQFSMNSISKQVYNPVVDTTAKNEKPQNEKIEKIDLKLEELLSNNNPTTRDMFEMEKLMTKKAELLEVEERDNKLEVGPYYEQIVNKDAYKHDSTYWDSIRPIPVSDEEQYTYRKHEEKQIQEESKSVVLKSLEIAAIGNNEWERSRKHYLFYPGLFALRNIGFNPVDGWQLKQHLKYRWNIDSLSHMIEITGHAGYAFSRESFFGHAHAVIEHIPSKNGVIILAGGYGSRNFNTGGDMGTPEDINMFYNLFIKESYVKYFHDTHFGIFHNIELINGLSMFTGLGYNKIDSLHNNTNFSFLYPDDQYLPNIPDNSELTVENISPREQVSYRIGLAYTPKMTYRIIKGKKYPERAKYPIIAAGYTGNILLPGNATGFGKVNFSVSQYFDFYKISSLKYKLETGTFVHNNNVHFSNFKHFRTYSEIFTTRWFNYEGYYLLNSYEYSTMGKYFEGHIHYKNKYLLLKRLPIISNTLWDENIYASWLTVEGKRPYFEVGYSMSDIMFMGEIGLFVGFKQHYFHGVGLKASFVF